MKVSELTGAELDYWVAQCELTSTLDGLLIKQAGDKRWTIVDKEDGSIFGLICDGIIARSKARRELSLPQNVFYYQPSVDWAYGGPLIERSGICIEREDHDGAEWYAQIPKWANGPAWQQATGKTPLIAAMRAFVASKFGEEVPEITQ
jgi:hypothetical protein